jgi:hypothetical protein
MKALGKICNSCSSFPIQFFDLWALFEITVEKRQNELKILSEFKLHIITGNNKKNCFICAIEKWHNSSNC